MIEISDIIQYADVKVGKLTIHIGDKTKRYKAIWYSHLSGPVNGENTLPSGVYPLKYKIFKGIVNCPMICFNKMFRPPIYPLGNLTYEQMLPYIYIQHPDGSEVTMEEWRQVCDIVSMYVTKFKLNEPTVDVTPKEFLNKVKLFDLENW